MDYTRQINPHFETIGKRRKLTGYDGILMDGEILIHCQEYSTYSQAETALNALVYELLTDLAEQGLVDELPAGAMLMPEGDILDTDGMRVSITAYVDRRRAVHEAELAADPPRPISYTVKTGEYSRT